MLFQSNIRDTDKSLQICIQSKRIHVGINVTIHDLKYSVTPGIPILSWDII